MREIKFRGKDVYDKAWYAGNVEYSDQTDKVYIKEFNGVRHEVIPETVGQYIGNKDGNGVEVYHGDRLQMYKHDDITGKHEKRRIWKKGQYEDDVREVAFMNGTFYTKGDYGIDVPFMSLARPGESYIVTGNIHEPQAEDVSKDVSE